MSACVKGPPHILVLSSPAGEAGMLAKTTSYRKLWAVGLPHNPSAVSEGNPDHRT